jgi:hypothetical protein
MQLLEASDNAGDVLDFTIMLLFQQVKNMVVSGKHLRNEILKLLVSERKISEDVAEVLMKLKVAVAEGQDVDSALLETVKTCGLSRDISKHTIDE